MLMNVKTLRFDTKRLYPPLFYHHVLGVYSCVKPAQRSFICSAKLYTAPLPERKREQMKEREQASARSKCRFLGWQQSARIERGTRNIGQNYHELKHQETLWGEAIKNAILHKPISPKRSNYPVSLRGYINSTYKVGAECVYFVSPY